MQHVTREEGHLLVAAVRILSHRDGAPPGVEAVAQLLGWQPETVRMKTVILHDLGALALVDSAFDHHLEVRDYPRLEELTPDDEITGMDEALADFDRKREQEQEKMERLFDDGEHERRRRERLKAMDSGLLDYRREKPRNPFGDED